MIFILEIKSLMIYNKNMRLKTINSVRFLRHLNDRIVEKGKECFYEDTCC